MTSLERFVRVEHALRPWLCKLPPELATKVFSRGRTWFSHKLEAEEPAFRTLVSDPIRAWNLTFRMPVWNAAGMFKSGGGFGTMLAQGAGAFVAGTTTQKPRAGNERNGIQWPAVAYPASKAASNWMGLPNPGHTVVATHLSRLPHEPGFPIGASLSADPGDEEDEAIRGLLAGFTAYSLAKVDYLELNESCPNVPGAHETGSIDDGLIRRLERISEAFLRKRHRPLPVVVKFSNDLDVHQLPRLLSTLVDLQYDGIILGNTSTRYKEIRPAIVHPEKKLYDAFTKAYGGGLSGAPLKQTSLELVRNASEILERMNVPQEFHVIRCGGVFSGSDVAASLQHNVVLHQWYTGYYEAFAKYGHDVYRRLSASIADLLSESRRTDTLS